jgi:hypothetical protein
MRIFLAVFRIKTTSHNKRTVPSNLMILLLILIRVPSSLSSEKYIRKEEDQEGLLQKIVMNYKISIKSMLKLPKMQVNLVEGERLFLVHIMMISLKSR